MIIFYTPNFVFSWDGEKFNNVWKFSDYAGGRASYGKIHAFSKAGNTLYTRRWGYGLYKLIDNKFQYIKNSEFLSQNRIELFYETKKGDLLLFSRTIGAYILKKNGEFIKSTNTVLNDWLIENGVYVNDHLKPFSDGTIPIHSRGGI